MPQFVQTRAFGFIIPKLMSLSEPEPRDITRILRDWTRGESDAINELMPLVYDELRRQAARHLRRENQDHTLQTTALIHEAYLKLIDQRNVEWQNRLHFFAIASQAMRRILVDHARTKHREKRGGKDVKVPLDDALGVGAAEKNTDLIALDEALTRLEVIDEQQVRVVELRYFSGLSLEDTADALGISRATAARDWSMAKAWLHRELTR
jgi:RNA polymerase sigma factor (TIGR02999 family)